MPARRTATWRSRGGVRSVPPCRPGTCTWRSDHVLYGGETLPYWDNLKRLFTTYFVSIEVGYYWAMVGVTFAVDYRQMLMNV